MSLSAFLDGLSPQQREDLIRRLHDLQEGCCYISGEPIDLQVHEVDLDHITARSRGGSDDESNIGLALAHHNRSKGVRDLELQRRIYRFYRDLDSRTKGAGKGELLTVGDVLQKVPGAGRLVSLTRLDLPVIRLAWTSGDGQPCSMDLPLIFDKSADPLVRASCFGHLPPEIVHHSNLNPRSIHDLEPMIEEFYYQHPQMQPSLAYFEPSSPGKSTGRIMLFDGQHKAAAQLYNRANGLLCRVFLANSMENDERLKQFVEELRRTNFRAHTKLAQLHFAQFIEDKVGHALYTDDREDLVRRLKQLGGDQKEITERRAYKALKEKNPEDAKEFKAHHVSYLRYEALTSKDLEIMKFVETVSARSRRYPISYDALKNFLDVFLFRDLSEEAIAESDIWRLRERENLSRLLDLLAEEVLTGRFKLDLGIYKLDEKIEQNPQAVPLDHLRAYRLFRKPALKVWAETLCDAISQYLVIRNRYEKAWHKERPLWAEIDVKEWEAVRRGVKAIVGHKVWAETQENLVGALASTRQKDWESILLYSAGREAARAAREALPRVECIGCRQRDGDGLNRSTFETSSFETGPRS